VGKDRNAGCSIVLFDICFFLLYFSSFTSGAHPPSLTIFCVKFFSIQFAFSLFDLSTMILLFFLKIMSTSLYWQRDFNQDKINNKQYI
jgi:predicted membrane protein